MSCDVALNGEVTGGKECSGTVSHDGEATPRNGPDGWKLRDEHTMTLQGKACDALETNAAATLEASFPCDAIVVN